MKIGENAPDFSLKDGDGNDWKLADQMGKIVVLLFYPADGTAVCTKQLCSVRDNWAEYEKTGATVVGISTDSAASHKKFAAEYDLPLVLLADEAGAVSEKYAAKSWIPGRSARAIVVIDKNGIVRHHQVQPISLLRPKDDEVFKAIAKANAA